MNKQLLGLGAIVLALGLSTNKVQAGILLEPYMGYGQGTTKLTPSGGNEISSKSTGVTLGARVAYTLPALFWFGVDYSMLTGGKSKTDGATTEDDITRSNLYAVAGVDFPILVRGWVGYGLMNDTTVKQTGGDAKLTGGTAIKAGVGFNMIPLMSVNLEMIKYSGPKATFGGADQALDKYDETGYNLSISVPFDL